MTEKNYTKQDIKKLVEKFQPYLDIPKERFIHNGYCHPGIGDAIEIGGGRFANSVFDPSKEYIHTPGLSTCIGLSVHDIDTKLTTLAHLHGLNDIDRFFYEIIHPSYENHSKPLEIGLVGGMYGDMGDLSAFILEDIYKNLLEIKDFKIKHFKVFEALGIFNPRDMHINSRTGEVKSGFRGWGATMVPFDYDIQKSIASKEDSKGRKK